MDSWQATRQSQTQTRSSGLASESLVAEICLQIVDACLFGTLFLAPLFFGGRTPVGRFVLITIACLASVAWFTRQAILKRAKWTRTRANLIGLAALLVVILQLAPLPTDVIRQLAPRAGSLLPLWTVETNDPVQLGVWPTLSFTPSSTKIALATLIAYMLLFVTVTQRLQSFADVERLLRLIALAVILMASFGLLQYFTSNGLFFWFYEHPFSSTYRVAKGTFTCRNHFAHFLVLGMGPLLAWIVLRLQEKKQVKYEQKINRKRCDIALILGLILVVFAVLLSLSRGGAVAMAIVITIGITLYYRRGLISCSFLYGFAALGILVIGMLSVYGYESVAGRLDDLTSGSINELDSNNGRRKIWAANLAAAQEGGFFGSGAGSHREIYPVYLPQSQNIEYTHAENGYLQIITECGYLGAGLLALSLLAIGRWCWQAIRQANSVRQLVAAAAVSSGLAASVVHSLVDFVWFIPTCMSLTILLASCALRLAQISAGEKVQAKMEMPWSRLRWVGLALVTSLASVWAGSVVFGPACGSTHWDRYLFTSKAQKIETVKRLNALQPDLGEKTGRNSLPEMAIFNLKHVLAHNPDSARANLRLAGKYLHLFGIRQHDSANSMSIDQIRDAAIASQFSSAQELRQWLRQAFGKDSDLLYQAYFHTRKSLQLCPLQGQGYLYLANLCFLTGHGQEAISAHITQSLLVRPHDGRVLFESGRQALLMGQGEKAFDLWSKVFHDPGPHQLQIIKLLGAHLPASVFLETFQPDWHILPYVWRWYKQIGSDGSQQAIMHYAKLLAAQECPEYPTGKAASIWLSVAKMQQTLNHQDSALVSLKLAYEADPSRYRIRRTYGQALLNSQQYRLAELHLRWCYFRKPIDTKLHKALAMARNGSIAHSANTTPSIATNASKPAYIK